MLSPAHLMSAALCEQLSLARSSALRGDYATAEVFYQGVAAQITRCVGYHVQGVEPGVAGLPAA